MKKTMMVAGLSLLGACGLMAVSPEEWKKEQKRLAELKEDAQNLAIGQTKLITDNEKLARLSRGLGKETSGITEKIDVIQGQLEQLQRQNKQLSTENARLKAAWEKDEKHEAEQMKEIEQHVGQLTNRSQKRIAELEQQVKNLTKFNSGEGDKVRRLQSEVGRLQSENEYLRRRL